MRLEVGRQLDADGVQVPMVVRLSQPRLPCGFALPAQIHGLVSPNIFFRHDSHSFGS